MASTTFIDYSQNTPIVASWLNDVNATTYTVAGTAKVAVQSAAAWVRFTATGGLVLVEQSNNILTVTRTSVGVYVIQYVVVLSNAANSYGISMNKAGFIFMTAETVGTVTINTNNTTNTPIDPDVVCVQVFGAN